MSLVESVGVFSFMPTYDYVCEKNGQLVEVRHGMQEVISNWGELCARLQRDPGNTPLDAPVRKLATGGQIVKSSSLGDAGPQCGAGACDRCSFN